MESIELVERTITQRLSDARRSRGISPDELERRLGVGPGWIAAFENGTSFPSISLLLAMASELQLEVRELWSGLPPVSGQDIVRSINAVPHQNGIELKFRYNKFDASYVLDNATLQDFSLVVAELRQGLAANTGSGEANDTVKRDAVVACFLKAVELWPHSNPSDIWWFLVYRAFCDELNHPAKNARLDLPQSWKRTSGWALEKIVVDHYAEHLAGEGVIISIADKQKREEIVSKVNVTDRLEADKIDVVLEGMTDQGPMFFGVVHVKASFAERRTDDIHMSQLLKTAGYTTPMWTMDCKSAPADVPINKGELGQATGNRSAKRKDIEDQGYFTRCFSYNTNTIPTDMTVPADRRIYNCDFSDPDDYFSKFIVSRWRSFLA